MKVVVIAIIETEFSREPALAKIMNNRLVRAAKELQELHLINLQGKRSTTHCITIHLSYNQKYKIRYQIINDVPAEIEFLAAERCSRLGYVRCRSMVAEEGRS